MAMVLVLRQTRAYVKQIIMDHSAKFHRAMVFSLTILLWYAQAEAHVQELILVFVMEMRLATLVPIATIIFAIQRLLVVKNST